MSDSLPLWEDSDTFFELDEADQRRLYALAMAGGDRLLLAALLETLAGEGRGDAGQEDTISPTLPVTRRELHALLVNHFSSDELRQLAFWLEVEHELVWGDGEEKPEIVRKLIAYFARRERLAELIDEARHLNPRAPWPARTPARPAAPTPAQFDIGPTIRTLRRRYAFVHPREPRLDTEAAAFLLEELRLDHRERPWVQRLAYRAAEVMRGRVERLNAQLERIEDRCDDEDWVVAVVGYTGFLFWLVDEEEQAWRWLVPRLVEGIAYGSFLRRRLIRAARRWEGQLSHQGRKRLAALNAATPFHSPPPDERSAAMLDELERLAKRGWLAGEGEAEQRAILAWQRGLLLAERGLFAEALRVYEEAERGLPVDGQALKRQLGEALYDLALNLIQPEGASESRYSDEAERLLTKVVAFLPGEEEAWVGFISFLFLGGKYEDIIATCQQAIALDEDNYLYSGFMGISYYLLGRYEESIAAYKRAIKLDATDHDSISGLGDVYQRLGRYEEAIAAYQKAMELDPDDSEGRSSLAGVYRKLGQEEEYRHHAQLARANLESQDTFAQSCIEAVCGDKDEALTFLEQAIAQGPLFRDLARRDPAFDFIRDDPRFRALVREDAPGK